MLGLIAVALSLTTSCASVKLDQGGAIISEQKLQQHILSLLAGPNPSLSSVADAVQAFPNPPPVDGLCDRAKSSLRGAAVSLEEQAAAVSVLGPYKCAAGVELDSALRSLWDALPESPSVEDYELVLAALGSTRSSNARKLVEKDVARLSKLIVDAAASSGKVRSKSGYPVSYAATGLAHKLVGHLRALGVKLSSEAESTVATLQGQLPKVIEQAAQSAWTAGGDRNGLLALAVILESASGPVRVVGLGDFLSQFAVPGSLQEAALLLRGSRAMSRLGLPAVHFRAEPSHVPQGSENALSIFALGPGGASVDLSGVSATVLDDAGVAAGESIGLRGSGGTYQIDAVKLPAAPGKYRLAVTGSTGRAEVEGTLAVTRIARTSFSAASVALEREDGSAVFEEESAFPDSLTANELGAATTLKVSSIVEVNVPATKVVLSSFEARTPPLLKLACEGTDDSVVLAMEKTASSATVKHSLASLYSHLGAKCATFSASLISFDPLSEPAEWQLATLRGLPAPESSASQPPSMAPLPVIRHIFRTPDRRPIRAVSLIFAGATGLPLVALIIVLSQLKVNLKGMPTSGAGGAAAAAFHGGLLGLVVLYAAFWLRLNLLQTLPPLAGLTALLCASGYILLSRVSASRLKQV